MRELTPGECRHVSQKAVCSNCKVGFLLTAPRKAAKLDLRCDNPDCQSEFSVVLREGNVVSGRQLKRNQPELYSGQVFSRHNWP
jgi:hypothetical protein